MTPSWHRLRAEPAERARVAVGLAFLVNGFAFASWISRTPALRATLGLTSGRLGLVLLCVSVGAVAALPGSGPLVQRIGAARAVLSGAVSVALGLVVLALGLSARAVPVAGIGLLLVGVGTSVWDVSMNVEGAAVEHRLDRTLMPRFHAGFSIGTVAGALVGAAVAASGLPMQGQLLATAALSSAAMAAAVRHFVTEPAAPRSSSPGTGAAAAWREPRTLAIGVMVLAFAFTEGSANDWLALAFVDGHQTSSATGAVAFAVFVAGMTIARIGGGGALERWGRVRVLRGSVGVAGAGLALAVFAPSLPAALLGAALWGLGVALGFPVGVSAAADDPHRAALRISVVSSIGYTAFLAGPPLIGFLAEEVGVLHALLVVAVALTVIAGTAQASRPLPPARPAPPADRGARSRA